MTMQQEEVQELMAERNKTMSSSNDGQVNQSIDMGIATQHFHDLKVWLKIPVVLIGLAAMGSVAIWGGSWNISLMTAAHTKQSGPEIVNLMAFPHFPIPSSGKAKQVAEDLARKAKEVLNCSTNLETDWLSDTGIQPKSVALEILRRGAEAILNNTSPLDLKLPTTKTSRNAYKAIQHNQEIHSLSDGMTESVENWLRNETMYSDIFLELGKSSSEVILGYLGSKENSSIKSKVIGEAGQVVFEMMGNELARCVKPLALSKRDTVISIMQDLKNNPEMNDTFTEMLPIEHGRRLLPLTLVTGNPINSAAFYLATCVTGGAIAVNINVCLYFCVSFRDFTISKIVVEFSLGLMLPDGYSGTVSVKIGNVRTGDPSDLTGLGLGWSVGGDELDKLHKRLPRHAQAGFGCGLGIPLSIDIVDLTEDLKRIIARNWTVCELEFGFSTPSVPGFDGNWPLDISASMAYGIELAR